MTRALGYVRQSLKSGTETVDTSLSLDAQAARIRDHVTAQGWELVDVVRDHDVRGDDPERPGLLAVLDRAPTVDVVIVFALSRLARDNLLQEVIWRRLRDAGCRLVSVSEPAAEDELVRGILGVVSQAERKRMGRMLSAAFAQRRQRGHLHGRIPYGYRSDAGVVTVHDEEADVIRLIFDLAEQGMGAARIAGELDRRGHRPRYAASWGVSSVLAILRNPVFGGRPIGPDGEEVEGLLPAIVEPERRAKVAATIESRPKVRRKDGASWLEGAVRHSCGARMYLTFSGTNYAERTGMLRCASLKRPPGQRCGERLGQVSVSRVEASAREAMAQAFRSLPSAQDAIARAHERAGGQDVARERKRIERQRDQALARHDRARTRYLDGKLPGDVLDAEDDRLALTLAGLDAELLALPQPPDEAMIRAARQDFAALADGVGIMADDRLGRVLLRAGTIEVSGEGVRLVWRPELAGFGDGPVVALPRPWAVRPRSI